MTIRQIRIFLEVVRCNSMSSAAKNLYLTQPTVSQAIAEIEDLYQIKLFDRLSKKLHITPAGELLLDYANRIMPLYDKVDRMLRENNIRQISFGATLTVGTCIVSPLILQYKKDYPDIKINVVIENTHEIEAHLLDGELDLALVEGVISNPDIIYRPVMEDTLVLITSPQSALACKSSITYEELSRLPIIMREKGSGTRESFERCMEERGCSVNCVWTSHNTEAIKNAVIAGHGVSVISQRLVQKEIETGTLATCTIEGFNNRRVFAITYHKDKFLFSYYKDLIGLCSSFGV